ncbi:hypothetical protein EV424DRAFT_1545395 [Suillus variegatus]|nr:hypothetical protein EV424DRAFT_1545395 [Suillus variegatus]
MTTIPSDWALHTTCIAGDFVHQLFAYYVGGRQMLVLPPLALDMPTMLACRQLARVLADAYLHPIQLDLDIIWYNEALNKRSTGRINKHEDALLERFPCGSNQFLDKPSVLLDSGGHIILWYLPDAISPWIQAEMETATVGMGHRLRTSMTGGEETKMHQHSSLLVPARPRGQPYGFSTHRSVRSRGVGNTEGGRWSYDYNIHAAPGTSGLGSSSSDASQVILGLDYHTDKARSMGYGKWPQ